LETSPGKQGETDNIDQNGWSSTARRLVPSYVTIVFLGFVSAPTLTVFTREIAATFFGPFADAAAAQELQRLSGRNVTI